MDKHVRWIVVGMLGLLPAIALAAEGPTSRPARALRKFERLRDEPVDLEKVQTFVRENSPNRWRAFQSLPEGKREEVRDRMHNFYKTVHGLLREGDPSLLENRKRQIRLEDEMFALRLKINAEGARPGEIKQGKQALREKVQQLIKLRMEERTHRLQRLKTLVDEEARRLEADQANFDKLVEQRFQAELSAGTSVEQPRQGKRDK